MRTCDPANARHRETTARLSAVCELQDATVLYVAALVGAPGHEACAPFDLQLWVYLPLDTGDRLDQLGHSVCGKVLGLHGYDHAVRGGEGVYGDHSQAR